MYKSIIFDIGGVLVDFDPKAYLVDRLCNAEMEEKVYDLTFGSEEWKKLDAGLISRFEGNATMLKNAQAAGCEFEVQGVLDDWTHILRPRHRMIELVRRLKNHGYCVYYLSNIPEDVLDFLTERDLKDLFDGGVISSACHFVKPEKEIYEKLIADCALTPERTLFIDDTLPNVEGAMKLGINGFHMHEKGMMDRFFL